MTIQLNNDKYGDVVAFLLKLESIFPRKEEIIIVPQRESTSQIRSIFNVELYK